MIVYVYVRVCVHACACVCTYTMKVSPLPWLLTVWHPWHRVVSNQGPKYFNRFSLWRYGDLMTVLSPQWKKTYTDKTIIIPFNQGKANLFKFLFALVSCIHLKFLMLPGETTFGSWDKFHNGLYNQNFVKKVTNWHMSRQLRCRVMCEIVSWSDHYFSVWNNNNFPKSSYTLCEIGLWTGDPISRESKNPWFPKLTVTVANTLRTPGCWTPTTKFPVNCPSKDDNKPVVNKCGFWGDE